jgi:hypothetical protein
LNQGSGSLINLEIPKSNKTSDFISNLVKSTDRPLYVAYFVYDQGSGKYDGSYLTWILLGYAVEIPIILIVVVYISTRRKVARIIKKLLKIRESIVNDINNNINNEIQIDPDIQKYYEKLAYRRFSMLHEQITINDFMDLIKTRNNAITTNNLDPKGNHACLRALDRILNNTDWSEHHSFSTALRGFVFRTPKDHKTNTTVTQK